MIHFALILKQKDGTKSVITEFLAELPLQYEFVNLTQAAIDHGASQPKPKRKRGRPAKETTE